VATSVYLASSEGLSGKSAIALGLLDQLSRRVGRVGVFRPIVRAKDAAGDHVLDLLLSRLEADLSAQVASGVGYDDVHADGDAAMSTIVERFHAVAERFEAMLVLGSDYTDVTSPTEFSYNARVAANLDAPMLLVITGAGRTPEQTRTAADAAVHEARAHHAQLLAVVANRVAPEAVAATAAALTSSLGDVPAYAVPAEPVLDSPTVRELMAAVKGSLAHGDESLLDRESLGLVVAAMTMPNVLDRLFEGCVVITPADRGDILLGLLLAHRSRTFPRPSGVVLNGGFALPEPISRLVEGLEIHVPVLTCEAGTMATAAALSGVAPRLTRNATRKIETALALFEQHVDGPALLERLDVSPSTVVTPLMFEHRLLDRARAADKHIVLAEGEEDRILTAADQLLRRRVVRLTLLGDPEAIRTRPAGWGSTSAGGPCSTRTTRRCAPGSPRSMPSCGPTRASPWSRPGTSSSTRATSAR